MYLPKSLERIDQFAFYGCTDMKYLVVRPGLKVVGANAFKGCFKLNGIIVDGDVPVIDEGCRLAGSEVCRVFAVGCDADAFSDDAGNEWMSGCAVESCESIEEAIAICEVSRAKMFGNKLFDGLERALRIAAEGLLVGLSDTNEDIWRVDAFAAGLSKLVVMDKERDIKNFFEEYSAFSVDSGEKITATLCLSKGISISAEFKDGKLYRIMLSEGLKNAIRKGMEVGSEEFGAGEEDEAVLRWLR
jgi:hypothetical protein